MHLQVVYPNSNRPLQIVKLYNLIDLRMLRKWIDTGANQKYPVNFKYAKIRRKVLGPLYCSLH